MGKYLELAQQAELKARAVWRSIEPDDLLDWLDTVRPLIRRALMAGDTSFTERSVVGAILQGQWRLWVYGGPGLAPTALCITEIIDFPKGRKMWVRYIAGEWQPFADNLVVMENYAHSMGCRRIEAHMRRGLTRKLPEDWKAERVIMVKDLS